MIQGLFCIRTASAEALAAARRAMASDDRWARRSLAAARRRFAEAALLATCERVETYGLCVAADAGATEAPEGWTILRGLDAARHLLRVAAGLESRMVGEPHILVQVAAAASEAGSSGSGGPFLDLLFDAALRAGRRARAETALAALASSHAAAAVEHVRRHLAGSHHSRVHIATHETPPRCDAAPEGARTAIVGILGGGAMALEIADALGRARVRIFARHVERTCAAVGGRGLEVLPLAALPERVSELSAVVAATTSPRPLVTRGDLAAARGALLVIDLGNPANIERDVATLPGVSLVTLDDLIAPVPAAEVLSAASAIVEQELARFARRVCPLDVILAAHGAGDGSEANDIAGKIAARTAQRRPGARVRAAFNLGTPRLEPALLRAGDASSTPRAPSQASPPTLVVPLTTSEGWFTRQRLPEMLGLPREDVDGRPGTALTAPVGSVRRLVRCVVQAARSAIEELTQRHRGHGLAVIVVGHGTTRHASSGDATREVAGEIARGLAHRAGVEVRSAFLDQEPRLEELAEVTCGAARVVVPWLIGGGDHALVDLRERLCRPDDQHPTVFLEPLGRGPEIVEAVLDLLDWHAPDRVLRLGTRRSRLARRQAEMAAERLEAAGVATEIHLLDTEGDRDLRRPIEAFATDGPFSDDLERALVHGHIDVAVHSLKDLPLLGDPETCIAALLPRGAAGEALVTRDGRRLADLAPGARVGTCSVRRALQLAALRPDLETAPMRGAVDARVASVDRGEFDGAILAVAGLERLGLAHRIAQRFAPHEMLCEAGQGAIALTVRADDRPARLGCAAVDDVPTRIAVEVERRIAAAVEQDGAPAAAAPVVAVHAQLDAAGRVQVRARILDRCTAAAHDATANGADADEAVTRLLASMVGAEVQA